ncbi:hypothetical protein [Gordonia terrae]|uniref:hypothetical protein n=1 Tax=Gordonia terrae TaxID=2055 RepID=UPI003F6C9C3B
MTSTVRQPKQRDEALGMLRFLDRWAPFAGGDEEIFPTFGVFPTVFYSRLAQCLRADPALAAGRDVDHLIAYCIRKSGDSADARTR